MNLCHKPPLIRDRVTTLNKRQPKKLTTSAPRCSSCIHYRSFITIPHTRVCDAVQATPGREPFPPTWMETVQPIKPYTILYTHHGVQFSEDYPPKIVLRKRPAEKVNFVLAGCFYWHS